MNDLLLPFLFYTIRKILKDLCGSGWKDPLDAKSQSRSSLTMQRLLKKHKIESGKASLYQYWI